MPVYLIDANVLIEAHKRFYGFHICPGFWDCLLKHHGGGRILSIDKVMEEILPGDELFQWVQSSAPHSFFVFTQSRTIVQNFANMVGWVQQERQFTQAAKDEFARVADGWLAAYALSCKDHVVVTLEEHAPTVKKRVPLPNVCEQFGIPYMDTFRMLKELGARFQLEN